MSYNTKLHGFPQKNVTTNDSIKPDSSALRAFTVLEHVVKAGIPVSLDDATQATGLPKPTVYRILCMLREADFLQREPLSKRYIIGTRLSSLAIDVLQHSTLRAECHGVLQEMVDETGETCNLTMLDGNEVLYLDRVETTYPLRLHMEVGARVPLHCTASGKIFLSQLSPKHIYRLLGKGPLKRYTDKTITDLAALEKHLKQVKATQLGTHDSELYNDSVAIAVPVADPTGRVYAALALHGPSSRLSINSCMAYVPTLRRGADAISSILTPRLGESPDTSAHSTKAQSKSRKSPS